MGDLGEDEKVLIWSQNLERFGLDRYGGVWNGIVNLQPGPVSNFLPGCHQPRSRAYHHPQSSSTCRDEGGEKSTILLPILSLTILMRRSMLVILDLLVMLALLPVSVSTVANPPAWDRVVQDGQAESIEFIISTSRSVDIS